MSDPNTTASQTERSSRLAVVSFACGIAAAAASVLGLALQYGVGIWWSLGSLSEQVSSWVLNAAFESLFAVVLVVAAIGTVSGLLSILRARLERRAVVGIIASVIAALLWLLSRRWGVL